MGSRNTDDGAEQVYAAAQKWVNCALLANDSLFTPGKPIWTPELLGELHTRVLNRPDEGSGSFLEKLGQQLAGSLPEVYQLMGEVLYVYYLPVFIKPKTKNDLVATVLGWSPTPVEIPAELCNGFQRGFVSLGIGMLLTPYQVGTLIETVEQWKELRPGEAEHLARSPWAFKDFLSNLRFRSRLLENRQNKGRGEHHLLLHSVFPDSFESMLSRFKERIVKAKAFSHFVVEPTKDVDYAIQQIRRGIKEALGKDFSFEDDDIRRYWKPNEGKSLLEKWEQVHP